MIAAGLADREMARRKALLTAVASVLRRVPYDDAVVTAGGLRIQLRLYYGPGLSGAASVSELCAGVAIAGGRVGSSGSIFHGVGLVPPTRSERAATRKSWTMGLREDPPLIRRAGGDREITPESIVPPGCAYVSDDGVHRQARASSSPSPWRDGGNARGGTTCRMGRFVNYIAMLERFMETAQVSSVDRQIVDLVVEGKSIQWISDELGIGRSTVHNRIVAVRKLAGIVGPGRGR